MTMITLQPQQSSIWWFFLLEGIAGIILGLMLVTAPGITMVALVTFLGFYWLIMGILALVRMFVDQSVPWIWSLLIGVIGILAGIVVVRHPLLAALTVPTVIVIVLGVEGLIMGVLEIIAGFTGGGIGSFIMGVLYVLVGLLLPPRRSQQHWRCLWSSACSFSCRAWRSSYWHSAPTPEGAALRRPVLRRAAFGFGFAARALCERRDRNLGTSRDVRENPSGASARVLITAVTRRRILYIRQSFCAGARRWGGAAAPLRRSCGRRMNAE